MAEEGNNSDGYKQQHQERGNTEDILKKYTDAIRGALRCRPGVSRECCSYFHYYLLGINNFFINKKILGFFVVFIVLFKTR